MSAHSGGPCQLVPGVRELMRADLERKSKASIWHAVCLSLLWCVLVGVGQVSPIDRAYGELGAVARELFSVTTPGDIVTPLPRNVIWRVEFRVLGSRDFGGWLQVDDGQRVDGSLLLARGSTIHERLQALYEREPGTSTEEAVAKIRDGLVVLRPRPNCRSLQRAVRVIQSVNCRVGQPRLFAEPEAISVYLSNRTVDLRWNALSRARADGRVTQMGEAILALPAAFEACLLVQRDSGDDRRESAGDQD
jgi:hypothetical protein